MPVKKGASTSKANETKSAALKKKKLNLNDFLKEVEIRAYEIYVERTSANMPGDEMGDWLRAEKEVKAKHDI